MDGFSLQIAVDKQDANYRAHIVLWDGTLLESIQSSPEAAAAALGLAIAQAMKDAGLPSAHFLALTQLPESDN
jgi:hypothetical protein